MSNGDLQVRKARGRYEAARLRPIERSTKPDRIYAPHRAFDEVFRTDGIRIVKTSVRAPQANAIAERFVRTIRAECLDWLLILNRRHLERVLRVFVEHYNTQRPHRALALQPPERGRPPPTSTVGEIRRHDRLGGLIREYYRDAA